MAAVLAVGGAAFYLFRYLNVESRVDPKVDSVSHARGSLPGGLGPIVQDANIINAKEGDGHIEPYRTYWWESGDTIYEPHKTEERWIRNTFEGRKKWDTVRNRFNLEMMSYRNPDEKWGLRPYNFPHNDI
jgi:hypothetical protein